MNIQITETLDIQGQRWRVSFGLHTVTFRSEQEAKGFVTTLQRRLKAPHQFPLGQRLAG